MRRLVFCFDGTWNTLDAPNPTNVVIVAESITPMGKGGVPQIIHYDPGVGTGHDDKWKGGLLGEGLIDKIADAYTFLIFNYEVGDEIFVFGFSRGAFTARAFVGFIRHVGVIQRRSAAHVTEAVKLYEKRQPGHGPDRDDLLAYRQRVSPEICVDVAEDAWRVANCHGYATGDASVLRIKYLGVWDTVAAIGVPSDIFFAPFANREQRYFDSDLTSMVVSARHAVSIDEDRVTFTPTLWPNVVELNARLGFDHSTGKAPYQQKWFVGDHGSVGGGGDVRGLSDRALQWVLDGALAMGLYVDEDPGSPIFRLMPDDLAPLKNMVPTRATLLARAEAAILTHSPRTNGPTRLEEVSDGAARRWGEPSVNLPERRSYRPKPLDGVTALLDALPPGAAPPPPAPPLIGGGAPVPGGHYTVAYGDQLRAIAKKAYGHADREDIIVAANASISDPERIYVGQVIYLPPSVPEPVPIAPAPTSA